MKKLAVLSLLLLAAVVSTPTSAHASCYWSTMFSPGWAGFDFYVGRACYTDGGFPQLISFTPYVPIG